ncbi:pentapeptide repeat-containing protein [Streptomyces sp. NPDC055721]|uniref:pentapeptide repeat-containing protein n=1 Tax=Streptomyces sp. NPDC127132 TaxID=3345374 RepID=UPI00362685F5
MALLLNAVRDASGQPSFRSANFLGATFPDGANFNGSNFVSACFNNVHFGGWVQFKRASFSDAAYLFNLTCEANITFAGAVFGGHALRIEGSFEGAYFPGVRFESTEIHIGPLICADRAVFTNAQFRSPASIEVAAPHMECRNSHWSSTATLRVRYASADFTNAWFEYPVSVSASAEPFVATFDRSTDERIFSGDPGVRLNSLRGVDATHLLLTDIDLSMCTFAGAFHLDQLRMHGNCSFASVPAGFRILPVPRRWTTRRVLAEEHNWRAQRQETSTDGWQLLPSSEGMGRSPGPQHIAILYRELRKSLEDAKNEPGAADFYYGEMEMRRLSHRWREVERWLLQTYWMLSGYGLRASRSICWLAVAMMITVILMMSFGLPVESPKQTATGILYSRSGQVSFKIDKEDPKNPTGNRFTTKRFEKALNVTLNSVVFRSSGQDLTTAGGYIEMASRISEPVLLALAVLAIRSRVKR